MLYSTITEKEPPKIIDKYIIEQDNEIKFYWDIFVTFILLMVCTVVPIHIVF